jgi:hypothetical protein
MKQISDFRANHHKRCHPAKIMARDSFSENQGRQQHGQNYNIVDDITSQIDNGYAILGLVEKINSCHFPVMNKEENNRGSPYGPDYVFDGIPPPLLRCFVIYCKSAFLQTSGRAQIPAEQPPEKD